MTVGFPPSRRRAPGSQNPGAISSTQSVYWPRLAATLTLAIAYLAGAWLTWNLWGDLIIDTGRELDVPRQLLAGGLLYRDVRYPYGPLAPYLNAALYAIGGVQVATLTTAGLVSGGCVVALSYRIGRLFVGRAAATAGGTMIVFANVFGHLYPVNIFNFVLPYSYPATYGMVAALASAFMLARHVRTDRARDFWMACAALSVVAVCKLELLVGVTGMYAAFLILQRARGSWRRAYAWGGVTALAIPAAVYTVFFVETGSRLWTDNLFLPGNVGATGFVLDHAGLDHFATGLGEMGWSLAGFAACAVVILVVAKRLSSSSRPFLRVGATLLMAGVAVAVLGALGPYRALRALPVLVSGMFLWSVGRALRPSADRTAVALAILSALACGCILRVVLRAGAEHYGFYLCVPAMLVLVIWWSREWPLVVARFGGHSKAVYAGGIAVLLAIGGVHATAAVRNDRRDYGAEPARVSTPMGTLPLLSTYAGTVDRAVDELRRIAADETVVAIPEGVPIEFLAGARNPLGIFSFLPQDFSGRDDEQTVLQRLIDARPEFVVFNSRDLSEYGKRQLGVDHAAALVKWVAVHYSIVASYHTRAFSVVIMRREE
jgi:hypothetical protein